MQNPPRDRYLTTREVAEMLNVTDRTLRRWRRQQRLVAIKIGGVVRYRMADLERAMGLEPEATLSNESSALDDFR